MKIASVIFNSFDVLHLANIDIFSTINARLLSLGICGWIIYISQRTYFFYLGNASFMQGNLLLKKNSSAWRMKK